MPATTIEEAVRLATWVDGQKKNAYFALATFKEEHKNDNGKRRVARKRKNVDQLKALWVDIDYKSCTPPTQAGAAKAMADFLRDTGFPPPSVAVSSGNGMHLYWPLDVPLGAGRWLELADCQLTTLVRLIPRESLDRRLRRTGRTRLTPSPWSSSEALDELLPQLTYFPHYPAALIDKEAIWNAHAQVSRRIWQGLLERRPVMLTGVPSTLKSTNVNRT
jgi:DNA primase